MYTATETPGFRTPEVSYALTLGRMGNDRSLFRCNNRSCWDPNVPLNVFNKTQEHSEDKAIKPADKRLVHSASVSIHCNT